MLNIPVSYIVLNKPHVSVLVGQGKAARMAEHVRVRIYGQAGALPITADHEPYRLTAQGAASLADKERVCFRSFSPALPAKP